MDRKGNHDKKELEDQTKGSGQLMVEQLKMVNAARKSLTKTEHLRLGRQEANFGQHESTHQTTDTESRGEDPSKGKGVDPTN